MTVLLFIAVIAVGLAVGGYIGVRYAEAKHRLDTDLAEFLLVPDELDGDRWRWGR